MKKKNQVVLNKKSKCAGCMALVSNAEGYRCSLGFIVSFTTEGKSHFAPTPEEKCYKPTTVGKLRKAKELVDHKKAEKTEE